jgi:hypothetical protein
MEDASLLQGSLLAAGLASSRADGASSRADGSVRALRGWPCLQAPPLDGPDLQGCHRRSVEPSPKCRYYWSAAIRGVPGMLEVLFYTVKLFAPSGALFRAAHACSPLPGSSVRGSPLRAARFRANLTQAAVAPAFLKPMVSEPMVPAPSTPRAFYASCIRRKSRRRVNYWAPGPALASRRLSDPAKPLRPRPVPGVGSTLPCPPIQPDNIRYCTLLKLVDYPLPRSLAYHTYNLHTAQRAPGGSGSGGLGPGAALGPGSWRKGAPAITGANRALLGYRDTTCRNVITGVVLQGCCFRDAASGIQAGRETRHESRPRPAERWLVAPRAGRLNISCRRVRCLSMSCLSISCVSVRELSTA